MGYGNQNLIYCKGSVVENRPEFHAEASDKKWKNFKVMLSRYLSTPIPEMEVTLTIGKEKFNTSTDEYGYFSAWIEPQQNYNPGWHPVMYRITTEEYEESSVEGEFLIVDSTAHFGTISDIDDTILVSHATQILRKLRLILTKNSKTRLPFAGVAESYQKLQADINPFFYISSSE